MDASPEATFFHTPLWYRLWSEHYGAPYRCDLLELPSGKRVIFPYLYQKAFHGLLRHLTTPGGTYAGPVAEAPVTPQEGIAVQKALEKQYPFFLLRQNPFSAVQLPGQQVTQENTFVMDFDVPPPELSRQWRRHHRDCIRYARREGMELHLAQKEKDWQQFFQGYKKRSESWDETGMRYDWPFLQHLFRQKTEEMQLWVLKRRDEYITGTFTFSQNQHAAAWLQGQAVHFSGWSPNVYLYFRVMEELYLQGISRFDFLVSGERSSLNHWKRGFRPQELPSPAYFRQPQWLRHYKNVRHKLPF